MLPNEETSCIKTPDPNVGKVFDKYRLIERLGAGGMGWVYRAEQARIKRHVAVKMLPFTMGNDEVNVKRIEREATAMGNLRHPNIATIFDFGFSDEGQPYLVMELISGRSLGNLLQEERTLEPLRAIRIMTQVAEAMDYAHKNGIIHRDLKPDNVMLTWEHKEDFVKILDFGIAKSVDSVVNVSQSLTRPGTVVGSPFYMSPEQCLGQKLDAGSDIYALGVMLYELVTGEVPCKGATIYETICKKSTEAPPPFPADFAEWTELERLAQTCLAPMRADRPESMQIVRDRLIALQPATVNIAMPAGMQISLTAESVAVAQSAAVSNLVPSPNPTDIYGAPLAPSRPSGSVDGSQPIDDSGIQLQTPSQIIEAIPEITEEQNTVVTSKVHDTADELETLASGIETEAVFATVSTGVTLSARNGFQISRKLAVIGAGFVIVLGGFAYKVGADSSTATVSGVNEVSTVKKPSVDSPVVVGLSGAQTPSKNNESASSGRAPQTQVQSSVLPPARIASPVPSKPSTAPPIRSKSRSSKSKISKAPVRRQAKARRAASPAPARGIPSAARGPVKRFLNHLLNGRF